ncbi:MAG: zinc-ribbon domain-containing protein [Promethearchaeota archaeon]
MEQENITLSLGIPYLILIFLTFVNASAFRNIYPFYPWVYESIGGLIAIIGCLILVPVFILTIIFLVTSNKTCETVAFGLAVPGWFLIIIGSIVGLYYVVTSYLTPILFLAFICPQLILGLGLFARRNYNALISLQTSPHHPYSHHYYQQTASHRVQSPTPRSRRGSVVIPNEVRLASTMGQSIKKCSRCRNSIDIKTLICYFCGARQPTTHLNHHNHRTLPYDLPPPPREPPRGSRREGISYCPNCGARTVLRALFCTQCGASLD